LVLILLFIMLKHLVIPLQTPHLELRMNTENLAHKEGEKLEGRYANYFKVGYNAFEFILDFGQLYSERNDVKFFTRIIANPISAKNLIEVLQESIAQYEQIHGTIKMQDPDL